MTRAKDELLRQRQTISRCNIHPLILFSSIQLVHMYQIHRLGRFRLLEISHPCDHALPGPKPDSKFPRFNDWVNWGGLRRLASCESNAAINDDRSACTNGVGAGAGAAVLGEAEIVVRRIVENSAWRPRIDVVAPSLVATGEARILTTEARKKETTLKKRIWCLSGCRREIGKGGD